MTEPITKVYLLNVPLEDDYKNTLYFNNLSSQNTYFSSRVVKSYTDFTYQRKDHVIRIPDIYDNIYNCNYVMYQNSNYSNKWFYAFIEKMEYINDGRTDIYIKTDVIQTWLFDYTIKPSFVEREHTNDDTIGKNTIPENLETGDYIEQEVTINEEKSFNFYYHNDDFQNPLVVIAVSETGLDLAIPNGAKVYNGVYSGLMLLTFPTTRDADWYISYIQRKVTGDPIYAVFMLPFRMATAGDGFEWIQYSDDGTSFTFAYVEYSNTAQYLKSGILNKPSVLDKDYTPRNKKLLTFPYCYMTLSNNSGSATNYKYEYFTEINGNYKSTCHFSIYGAISVGGSIKAYPIHYKKGNTGLNHNEDNLIEGLDAGKMPTCGWINDAYTNWLTGNAVNMALNFTKDVATIGVGIGTGNVGVVASGSMGIANSVSQIYEHSLMPVTAKGGVNQGDLIFGKGITYTPYKMSIKEEYAKVIDGYFDMFGYKVNSVKVPNTNHRSRWWYIKTIDINIDGAIPNEDMQEIKNSYNKGITFWRNASEIQNYNLSNNIV